MYDREQREWQRIPVNMAAKCRAVDGPARYETTRIVDMHQHGCSLLGPVAFQQGQMVRLVLEIPFEGSISLTGEVKWAEPANDEGEYSAGLGFVIDSPAAEDTCLKLYHFCLLRQPKH